METITVRSISDACEYPIGVKHPSGTTFEIEPQYLDTLVALRLVTRTDAADPPTTSKKGRR